MRGKIFCLLVLCLLVGVASADTLIVYAPDTNADARMGWTGAGTTFATAIGNNGNTITNTSTNTSAIAIVTDATGWATVLGFAWSGNTTIPAGMSVESAIFGVYGDGVKQNDFTYMNATVIAISPTNPLVLASSDWQKRNKALKYSNTIEYASWNSAGYNNFTITNLSAINTAGITSLLVTTGGDYYSIQPGTGLNKYQRLGIYDTSNTGTNKDPFLQIVYGDLTPPASITNLAHVTTCNSINWTWDNPVDADYDYVRIFQNGSFRDSKGRLFSSDLWEDLAELTEYEFASHTCDVYGNCNTTWVNQTAITGSCVTPTPTPTLTPQGDAGFDGYAHFNFTAWNTTPMDDWNWSINEIFSGNGTTSFLNTWLLWGQIHNITLKISNATNNFTISQFYNLHNVTPTITSTPTPWQPEIMPSTEFDARLSNLIGYWWIPALLLVIWLLFRRG